VDGVVAGAVVVSADVDAGGVVAGGVDVVVLVAVFDGVDGVVAVLTLALPQS
jgi:hypothetical protein